MPSQQKIKTFLWFDGNAEEAANHYISIFENSKILNVARYGEAGPGPKGSVMIVAFQLEGQEFVALNGGPQSKFTEAISLMVSCETQKEVDALWRKLSAGGAESQCGWLKDKFGLSWQTSHGGDAADEEDRHRRARARPPRAVAHDSPRVARLRSGRRVS